MILHLCSESWSFIFPTNFEFSSLELWNLNKILNKISWKQNYKYNTQWEHNYDLPLFYIFHNYFFSIELHYTCLNSWGISHAREFSSRRRVRGTWNGKDWTSVLYGFFFWFSLFSFSLPLLRERLPSKYLLSLFWIGSVFDRVLHWHLW